MAANVAFKNSKTGEVKSLKVGWSWVLFLFSSFLGLPLFLRKLHVWGAFFLALWIVNIVVPAMASSPEEAQIASLSISLIFLGLAIFMGIKGNELTAKNYLENG